MNNLQVLVRCYDKVATRSVSATCYFGREAPAARHTARGPSLPPRFGGRLWGTWPGGGRNLLHGPPGRHRCPQSPYHYLLRD